MAVRRRKLVLDPPDLELLLDRLESAVDPIFELVCELFDEHYQGAAEGQFAEACLFANKIVGILLMRALPEEFLSTAPTPTRADVGTPKKVAVLRQRFRRQQELFSELDAQADQFRSGLKVRKPQGIRRPIVVGREAG
ncbi:hypothetical protein KIH39_26440 [Telmatocola sphagniphila]|uniref:Uncharacterized protein n=1 Tax=Telmatocola sphagniphila TaxID=1123043 RepID=A0A8E6ETE1_9BACT|nr:hypothetical protein [Telmatocola sphagniphila]QVL32329.1 hypothetical protein KIH39_26440 [Telmatocola sphagniphila]